ncbi:MAG: thioesterase, partial [Streptomyces sp.]|nr:thioesterase [Streptomyces sp.]
CSLRGDHDGLVSAEEGRQWRDATTAGFHYLEFPGDHMYLVDHGPQILDVIETQFPRST